MGSLFDNDDVFDEEVLVDSLSDDVDSAPDPENVTSRSNPDFYGHDDIERALLKDYQSGRLPHAIVLAGPAGVGKATFAFRLARFLLAESPSQDAGLFGEGAPVQSMHIAPEHPVFRRVASGGHADLLTIEREYDEKKGRFKNEISIEAVRRIPGFLRKTAAEGGWRVVIVDSAEYISSYNQNVLLKILEEPPTKTVLIVTTSQPGLLLPTIRSRCRVVHFDPLSKDVMTRLLERHAPGLGADDRTILETVAAGSIGAAVQYCNNNGITLYKDVMKILATVPSLDVQAVHDFADKTAKAGAENNYDTFRDLMISLCEQQARHAMRGQAHAQDMLSNIRQAYSDRHFFGAWEKVTEHFHQAEVYNLDKRQAIIGAFLMIQKPDFAPLQVRG